MSWLFGGGKSAKPEFTDISINTSIATLPVPMIWGCAAGAINLLWYGNFQAIAVKQSGGKGGGSGCFAPETKVSTPHCARYIEDMRVGDPVWCLDPETGAKVMGRVALVHKHDVANDSHDRMLRVRHGRGELHVTENHYLWRDGVEKIEAKDWKVGDRLALEEDGMSAIKEIVSSPDIAFTYNLTIEPHHNYFADGVLVHNGGGSKKSYDYQTGCIFGICCGPVAGFGNIWKGKDQYGSPGALGLTAFLGSSSQSAWGWLVSYNASQALNYRYVAYLCSANFDLGSNDALPQLKIETYGVLYNTGINGRMSQHLFFAGGVLPVTNRGKQLGRLGTRLFDREHREMTDGASTRLDPHAVLQDEYFAPGWHDPQPKTRQFIVEDEIVLGFDFSGFQCAFRQSSHGACIHPDYVHARQSARFRGSTVEARGFKTVRKSGKHRVALPAP